MQNRLISVIALSTGLLLSSCGGGGGGGGVVAAALANTTVLLQDGNIIGATVTDNAATVATPLGAGSYQFAANYVIQLPIHIRSQNSAATVSACMDTLPATVCDPANILTFQDLDGNGTFSTGDVMYNSSMDISFAPSTVAGTVIFANPLSSLISAAGVAPAFAGLTSAQVLASANGDITLAAANVQSVAAQWLAIQEALINAGADRVAMTAFILSIAQNSTGVNLAADIQAALTLPGGVAAATLFTGASVPTQANLQAAAGNIATAISATIAGAAATATNHEAIISVATNAVPVTALTAAAYIAQLAGASAALNSSISAANFNLQSGVIQTAVNNQATGITTLVNGMFIMPAYDLVTKVSVPAVTVLDAYTGFTLTHNAAANTITIGGVDAVGAPTIANKVLTFDAIAQKYGFANVGANLFISIDLNFSGARLLSVCNDYAGNPLAVPLCTLHHFTLPTQAEVCGLTFNDATFFADQTVGVAFTAGHADYALGARFTTMNGQTSVCP